MMRKTTLALCLAVLCAGFLATPIFAQDRAGDQAPVLEEGLLQESLVEIAPAPACSVAEENASVAESTEGIAGLPGLFELPTSSWNCNGCVEPSPCTTHAECGYPQGRCIANICRCICDPDV